MNSDLEETKGVVMTKTLLGKVPVVAVLAILIAVLATPVSAGGGGISLKGQAGRFDTTTFKALGNSTDAQASWTNKVALDGKAAVVDGVNGQTVGSLGDLAFSFTGVCNGGSPRFNLFYSNDGGITNGILFLGCNNVTLTTPTGAPDWQTATFSHAFILAGGSGGGSCPDPCSINDTSTVTSLSVLIDIVGSNNIDRVSVNGVTTGEPNGS